MAQYKDFRSFLRKTAHGETLRHAKRRVFPRGDDYRALKLYLNGKYRGKYLPDSLILEFERLWDEYEADTAGGEALSKDI